MKATKIIFRLALLAAFVLTYVSPPRFTDVESESLEGEWYELVS